MNGSVPCFPPGRRVRHDRPHLHRDARRGAADRGPAACGAGRRADGGQRRRGRRRVRAAGPLGTRSRAVGDDDRPAPAGRGAGRARDGRGAAARRRDGRRGDGGADDPPLERLAGGRGGGAARRARARRRAGVAEMLRVARGPVVVWSFDPEAIDEFWLVRDYVPEIAELDRGRFPPVDEFAKALGGARIEPVPIPRDCRDGVLAAFYARPERYLDPVVRAGMSPFAVIDAEPAMARLAEDLRSGAWDARWGHLREAPELDAGYRLFIAQR